MAMPMDFSSFFMGYPAMSGVARYVGRGPAPMGRPFGAPGLPGRSPAEAGGAPLTAGPYRLGAYSPVGPMPMLPSFMPGPPPPQPQPSFAQLPIGQVFGPVSQALTQEQQHFNNRMRILQGAYDRGLAMAPPDPRQVSRILLGQARRRDVHGGQGRH